MRKGEYLEQIQMLLNEIAKDSNVEETVQKGADETKVPLRENTFDAQQSREKDKPREGSDVESSSEDELSDD